MTVFRSFSSPPFLLHLKPWNLNRGNDFIFYFRGVLFILVYYDNKSVLREISNPSYYHCSWYRKVGTDPSFLWKAPTLKSETLTQLRNVVGSKGMKVFAMQLFLEMVVQAILFDCSWLLIVHIKITKLRQTFFHIFYMCVRFYIECTLNNSRECTF